MKRHLTCGSLPLLQGLSIAVLAVFAALACALPHPAFADELSTASGAVLQSGQGTLDSAAGSLAAQGENTFLSSYATATGDEDDPYLVYSEQDLYELAKVVNGCEPQGGKWVETGADPDPLDGKFVSLQDDIALTGAFTPIGIGTQTYNMYGSSIVSTLVFKGTFLGNGHVISNFSATAASNPAYGSTATTKHDANTFSALFGAIAGATVKDVVVAIAPDVAFGAYSGGLVGIAVDGGNEVTHCAVRGDIAGGGPVGGLVGAFYPLSSGTLKVTDSYHVGAVSSSGSAGGLVGNNGAAGLSIASSYQSGAVSGSGDNFVGALVGAGTAKVLATGCAADSAAQLLGANHTSSTTAGCVSGVTDWRAAAVQEALGAAAYDFSDEATQNGEAAPPFLQAVSPMAYKVTFDAGGEGTTGSLPVVEKQLEGATFEVPACTLTRLGYDFAGWKASWRGAPDAVYQAGEAFVMPAASVTFTAQWDAWEAVTLSTEVELRQFAEDVNAGLVSTAGHTYVLANDIALVRGSFTPIGTGAHPFKGTFDGAGHVISGLAVGDEAAVSITGSSYLAAGLFGKTESATICNLGVTGAVDAPNCVYAAGLVAYASGTKSAPTRIHDCFARVSVSGKGYVGGLAGYLIFSFLQDSYATGTVRSDNAGSDLRMGGLAGNIVPGAGRVLADGECLVQGCYTACDVQGPSGGTGKVAALVGCAYDTAFTEDGGWTRMAGCYALECDLPLYHAYSQSEQTSAPAPNSSKIEFMLTASQLAAAADEGKLGGAFKADNAYADFQLNGGFPVMAWEALPEVAYPVSYVLAGGSWRAGADVPYSYSPEDSLALPDAGMLETRDDYLFVGWYDNGAYEGEPVSGIAAGSSGAKQFFAMWRHRSLLRADALAEAAAAAPLAEGVLVSATGDGSDVHVDAQWVTSAAMAALTGAVEAVNELPASAGVAEIQVARTSLAQAVAAFKPTAGLMKYSLADAQVRLSFATCTYDATAKSPKVAVLYGDEVLVSGTDYTLREPAGRVDAGAYTYQVIGKGRYGSTAKATLTIQPAAITSLMLVQTAFTYDGKAKQPAAKAVKAGSLAVPEDGYDIAWSYNVLASDVAKATVTGKGNFTGSVVATFSIAKATGSLSVAPAQPTVKATYGKATSVAASGAFKVAANKSGGTVTYKKTSGDAKIAVSKVGKVTVKKGLAAGTYTVKVRASSAATANYKTASANTSFKVKVAKAKNALALKGKTATVKAAKVKKAAVKLAAAKVVTVKKNVSKAKLTYKKASGNKKIAVSKAGKVTVGKGLAKGTYKVKVKVTSKATKNYKAATKTVTFKVKVK